jgi:hypothetical protein
MNKEAIWFKKGALYGAHSSAFRLGRLPSLPNRERYISRGGE